MMLKSMYLKLWWHIFVLFFFFFGHNNVEVQLLLGQFLFYFFGNVEYHVNNIYDDWQPFILFYFILFYSINK